MGDIVDYYTKKVSWINTTVIEVDERESEDGDENKKIKLIKVAIDQLDNIGEDNEIA